MDYKNVVIFDKPYLEDKTKEGLAVNWAVMSGACNKCPHLKRCETDETFIFPQDTACMKKKAQM